MTPFDFLNSINDNKKNLIIDDQTEKEYNAYMVNRGLSYFTDTALIANEMNLSAQLSNKMQYDFLRNIVRRRKRFSKWFKPENESHIENIKKYYGYSTEKARQVIHLLSSDQISQIIEKTSIGGKKRP